jgi:hypothetical protein
MVQRQNRWVAHATHLLSIFSRWIHSQRPHVLHHSGRRTPDEIAAYFRQAIPEVQGVRVLAKIGMAAAGRWSLVGGTAVSEHPAVGSEQPVASPARRDRNR